jgi:hypothetical protein
MPPSIPNDSLIAKCSPRGWDQGMVVWTSYFAKYWPLAKGETPKEFTTKHPAMAYVMEHWTSRKNFHRNIDSIVVTNLYCGYGKGWDIIVEDTIVDHKDRKTDAQREAEKLLDGKC